MLGPGFFALKKLNKPWFWSLFFLLNSREEVGESCLIDLGLFFARFACSFGWTLSELLGLDKFRLRLNKSHLVLLNSDGKQSIGSCSVRLWTCLQPALLNWFTLLLFTF